MSNFTEIKMKKRYIPLIILIAWLPFIMALWDKDKPSASTSLRDSNPEILANFSALESVIGQDHEFSTGGTNSGKHIQVTFDDPLSSAPSSVAASEGVLYLLDVSSKAELHFEDEDEHTLQMTSGGNLYSSTNLEIAGTSTFTGAVTANGGITLGAGDDLIGSSTSDITFNTDKFTVAGATGNTVIAGTLGVTGVATLGDSSQMATSAAPTEDADLSNKKYVDDQCDAHVPTSLSGASDSIGETAIGELQIKWGYSAISTNGDNAVTFTGAGLTAFSNECYQVVLTAGDSTETSYDYQLIVHTISATGFTIRARIADRHSPVRWIAIGY
jgi:hypothetical protein